MCHGLVISESADKNDTVAFYFVINSFTCDYYNLKKIPRVYLADTTQSLHTQLHDYTLLPAGYKFKQQV